MPKKDRETARIEDRMRKNFINWLEEAGLAKNYEKAAERIGISVTYIKKIKAGTRPFPKVHATAWRIARSLGHLQDHLPMENPPPADPTLIPAFQLRPTPGVDIDPELLEEAAEAERRLQDKHLAKMRDRQAAQRAMRLVKGKGKAT